MTTDGGTTWNRQANGTGIYGLSCPSTLVCVGVGIGGLVMYTANGGTSWQSQVLGGGTIQFLSGVSCPTASICYAAGSLGTLWKSTDGGVSWTAQSSGTTTLGIIGASCATATNCMLVGDGGLFDRTADGGATWNLGYLSSFALSAVSCPSVTACTAVGPKGEIEVTTNGGVSWIRSIIGAFGLTAISCPDTTVCLASADDGNVYIGNLGAWGPTSVGERGRLWSVSCASKAACFAAGDYGFIAATTVGGTGWVAQSPTYAAAGTTYSGISCPSAITCFVGGSAQGPGTSQVGILQWTSDGGATWTNQATPNNTGAGAISCPSTSTCFALGAGNVINTTNSGTTWTAQNSGTALLQTLTCPSTAVCFAAGSAGAIVATMDGGAHWSSQTSGTTANLTSVSCPSTTVCLAGGMIAATGTIIFVGTGNGGASWSQLSTQAPGYLYALSCPSTTVCFAAEAGAIFGSTDGGATWKNESPSGFNGLLYSVSCVTSTTCTAVGEGGAALGTSDGVTWTTQYPGAVLYWVSCAPGTTTCFAAGAQANIMRTPNMGTSWLHAAAWNLTDSLHGVSCPTTTTCFATTSSSINVTTNGGAGWKEAFTLRGASVAGWSCSSGNCSLSRLSCPTTSVCVAAGSCCSQPSIGFVLRTADAGVSWSTVVLPVTSWPTDVSCPSNSTCVAALNSGATTTSADGGATWSSAVTAAPAGLSGISCPSTTVCFATGGGSPGKVYVTTNAGASWSLSFDVATDPLAGSTKSFRAINCPSVSTCNAVGLSGLLATTTDGGTHWRTDNTLSNANVTNVSCPTAGTCFATTDTSAILRSTDTGGDWAVQFGGNFSPGPSFSYGAAGSYDAISCPSATACFAVGGYGYVVATTTGGAAWRKSAPQGTTDVLLSISCPGASDCYAAGISPGLDPGGIEVTHDGGNTWTKHGLIGADSADAMSCPSTTTCFAVGWPGAIYQTVDGGTTWTPEPNALTGADVSLESVSCVSSTACTAVGTSGVVLATSDGVTWNGQTSTNQNLWGVTCTSTDFCVAVGDNGTAIVLSSGFWRSSPTGTTNALTSVSCPTADQCFAVGNAGIVLVTANQGASWSAQSSGVTYNLLGLSCVQAGECLAAGVAGTLVYTTDGTTWAPAPSPTFNTLHSIAFLGSGRVWAVGNGGTILVNPNMFPPVPPSVVTVSPSSGVAAGGTTVTITGRGFSNGVTVVAFGGTAAASFTVLNDRTISAVTPARIVSTVHVTVTATNGTSATSINDQFTFSGLTSFFTWYDLASPGMLNDNIHLLNGSGSVANITVTMPGALGVNVVLPAGQETYVSFGQGHIGGPVVVNADQQIQASQRVQYYQTFNEVWAEGAAQASATSYFNWYDKASPGMFNDNIHLLNPGSASATVTVSLPGLTPLTATIGAGAEAYVSFPKGTIGGPVTVTSSQPVLATQRVQYYSSFKEVWAESAAQAAAKTYLNWYDKASPGMSIDNIHVINPGSSDAHVTVGLPGAGDQVITVPTGGESFVTFPAGTIGGPLMVSSDQPVLASQRVVYYASFNEVWAESAAQAATTSHVTWYDKASPGMFNDNFHILNPGTLSATVTVALPGAAPQQTTVAAGAESFVSFPPGTIGGPATVTSTQPVLASQRVQYYSSFNEIWAA
jgi:photosystem II stability/assembly factor-like uncharacterized protein